MQLFGPPISEPFILFPKNTMYVNWALIIGSTWNTGKTPVTDATGTLSVYDQTGTVVPGADALPMSTTATPGTYQAVISGGSFNPPEGQNYTTVITMTSPTAGGPGVWTIPTIVRYRTTP